MKTYFEIENKTVTCVTNDTSSICVIAAPDKLETQEILETLNIDQYDLDSALDPDEISRVEFALNRISMIWKIPKQVSVDQDLRFEVASVGIFLEQPKLTLITAADLVQFPAKEFHGIESTTDVLLKYLFLTTRHYLSHLKVIKQITTELECKISSSMENRYLFQMFSLSESLTYYMTAIEGNLACLAKLFARAEKLGFTKNQIDFLDDTVLENKQCARQAQIYSSILSGLMDARGTIINNNVNVLLKDLTIINVIFLPLNLFASMGGMSEFSMMTHGIDWKVSYSLFSVAMLLIGWLTWFVLARLYKGTETKIKKHVSRSGL